METYNKNEQKKVIKRTSEDVEKFKKDFTKLLNSFN
jgi:hypothetical protein